MAIESICVGKKEAYMEYPDDLYYTRNHLWVRIQGSRATVGVTDYAQREMGEVLFVDLPEEGSQVEKDDVFGSLESSKTVAELRCPVSGEIVSISKDLEEEPSLVNDDPYGRGWLIVVEIDDPNELEEMINAADYEELLEQEAEEDEEE
jgi:glycine cleavage system H protein